MAKLAIISVLLLYISSLTCHAEYSSFLECISSHSASEHGNLLQHIHTPTSPKYVSLLQATSKNPRWLNSTGELPFLIFSPYEETEIGPIIKCSKAFDHHIRVCSGGHDYEGLSFRSKTPFIMLALANLNQTTVNIEEETAWIQTGVTLGQLYYEISKKSQVHAFPGGLYPGVGSGGHISGGGFGTLVRKYGLAADNILDARVMDSNGSILDRKTMGEDLFWAVRGGGGASFCVVLAWKLRLVRVPSNVTAFAFRRRLDREELGLLQKWQSESHSLSKDLFTRILVQNLVSGESGSEKTVRVTYQGLYLGPASELVPDLGKIFPKFGLKVEDCFKPPVGNESCSDKPCIKTFCYQVPWIRSVLFFSGKPTDSPLEILLEKKKGPIQGYYKATSDFLKKPIPNGGWEMIRNMFMSEQSPMMIIDPFGGRMDEIAEDETPFPHRKGTLFVVQYLTYWGPNNDKEEARKHVTWIRKLYREMKPYVADNPRAAYLNYRDLYLGQNNGNYSYDNAKAWGEKYFKGNFERLARVKGKVDPGNFFRFEQSVPVLL